MAGRHLRTYIRTVKGLKKKQPFFAVTGGIFTAATGAWWESRPFQTAGFAAQVGGRLARWGRRKASSPRGGKTPQPPRFKRKKKETNKQTKHQSFKTLSHAWGVCMQTSLFWTLCGVRVFTPRGYSPPPRTPRAASRRANQGLWWHPPTPPRNAAPGRPPPAPPAPRAGGWGQVGAGRGMGRQGCGQGAGRKAISSAFLAGFRSRQLFPLPSRRGEEGSDHFKEETFCMRQRPELLSLRYPDYYY